MITLNSIANLLLAVAIIAALVAWIVGLAQWDGKCPCDPKECEDCPYSGTGCDNDPKTRKETHQ